MSAVERVHELVTPIVERNHAQLYDVEHESGILRIMVDREGGIDVDTIGELSQQISQALDEHDPFPDQRYLLEVTSPGIERKLRTPQHFAAQIDNEVSVKLRTAVDGVRRIEGVVAASDEGGIEITVEGVPRRISYDDIESARTVFHWPGSLEDQASSPKKKPKPTNKKASTR